MAGFDSELDALFKSSVGASVPSKPVRQPTVIPTPTIPTNLQASTSAPTKRKHEKKVVFTDQSGAKRRKPNASERQIKGGKPKQDDNLSEDDDPTVEDAYHQRQKDTAKSKTSKSTPPKAKAKAPLEQHDSEPRSESDSDSDPDAPPPVHESLTQKPEGERPRKKKYVPEGETSEQRDARTIFIGNLPASVAKSSAKKSLHKHILNCLVASYPELPRPTIESSRFRSVAFKTPTSKLPSDALPNSKSKPNNPSSEHNKTRAAEWRATQDTEGITHKTFQTPAQKKKTAYITGALHDSAKSSSSAYVVFAYPTPVEGVEPAWDPAEVAARAVLACNGSKFMERALRVDRVGKREEDKQDPRTMVFVGNLDFETDEDALREMFEKLVEQERGKSEAQGDGSDSESEDEDESEGGENEKEDGSEEESEGEEEKEDKGDKDVNAGKTKSAPQDSVAAKTWVKSVRIVRDKDTQLGKGFGYVQFVDRASVDEILALEPGTIKLAKRKLRVQRCKTVPGVSLPKTKVPFPEDKVKDPKKASKGDSNQKSDRQKGRPTTSKPALPRADPNLGERIRSLSKEERKSVKASDADRLARRLAKKKAKIISERGARKASSSKASILGGRPGGPKSKKPKSGKSGKRERSDKSLLKKNVKNLYDLRRTLLITMCLAFWTLTHPQYALIIAANRDEFLSRPTIPADWHNFDTPGAGGEKHVLSGRDVMAGGTWLGMNKRGEVTLLTNITEPFGKYSSSRGELASNFLTMSPPNETSERISPYVKALVSEQRSYAGFNLLLLSPSISSGRIDYHGVMVTNSQGGGEITSRPLSERECLSCGLSNSNDTAFESSDKGEWPKVSEGRKLFENVVSQEDLDENGLVEALCEIMSTENPTRPTTRYGLRTTISVPAIPVEPGTWSKTTNPSANELPASTDAAPALNVENRKDYYGTRLTSIILVHRNGRVTFVERDVWVQKDGAGEPEKCSDTESQRRFDFQLETRGYAGTG
ncbi:Ser/Thr-rich protein T10 in DGCR region OS=Mus musculus GN=T10 PE=2 SV=1 [Rhizoctonia solani AG-1 IB]|uniref:Ser/Thr-rich protein T10 in DGCR region n=1 Tax=Thanatephorus cucumeris (strain AG1-IB / isolate 7/3/14) TaxID=1108050 RepID=A0A0B7FRW2_THACB|nr:Ser/Thr-rich protein T10 in DGCR region OS=Mus musculus GN=T10 PE=2 SV=1 [Rhizoctonia solani AG-1 IB]